MKYKQHIVTPDEVRNNRNLRLFRRIRILFAVVNPVISVVVLSMIALGVI
ncbi:MAG: hypothetical protein AAE976_05600 [Thermoplasmataceae archaeon]